MDAENSSSWPDLLYYQARSYEKLGNKEKAQEMYRELISQGDRQLERGRIDAGIGVEEGLVEGNIPLSEAYYLKALGSLGLVQQEEAERFFNKALDAYRNNLWAQVHRKSVQ